MILGQFWHPEWRGIICNVTWPCCRASCAAVCVGQPVLDLGTNGGSKCDSIQSRLYEMLVYLKQRFISSSTVHQVCHYELFYRSWKTTCWETVVKNLPLRQLRWAVYCWASKYRQMHACSETVIPLLLYISAVVSAVNPCRRGHYPLFSFLSACPVCSSCPVMPCLVPLWKEQAENGMQTLLQVSVATCCKCFMPLLGHTLLMTRSPFACTRLCLIIYVSM